MKLFFLLFFLFLFIGCGKGVEEKSSFPENNASPVENELFQEALAKIQADFDAANIKVKLDSIPYNINELNGAMGVCYKKENEGVVGIALDHDLFEREREDEGAYGVLYKVLLHEIGHCFFNRDHDEDYFQVDGFDMMIKFYPDQNPMRTSSMAQSLMSELGFYRVPKTIWPYYVREIAGLDRIRTWEDIRQFAEITLSPHSLLPLPPASVE